MKAHIVSRSLAALATRAPALAFRLADLIAAVAWPRLSLERMQSVFGHLSTTDARRVAEHARNAELRNQIVMQMMYSHGMDSIRRLVARNDLLSTLRSPMILGTFHLGALTALGPALESVPGEVLVLRRRGKHEGIKSRLTVELTGGDEQHRAYVFHRALEWLGNRGSVFMPLDPEQAVRIAVPFRGRSLQLARGPFAMSRIMKVPIMPILARWRGARVEIVVGDPIPPGDDESTMAAATAAWLERYLLECPLEISERILTLTT